MTTPQSRQKIVMGVLALGLAVIGARFVFIQVVKSDVLHDMAQRRHVRMERFVPLRGDIVDRNGESLAISVPAVSLYAHPRQLNEEGKVQVCDILKRIGLSTSCPQLNRDTAFVWLGRDLPREHVNDVLGDIDDIDGFGWSSGSVRRYPKGDLAGQVLGFVGVDGQGLEGIEKSFDHVLQPQLAEIQVQLDARRRLLLQPADLRNLQTTRRSVELTIDAGLQARVEQSLAQAMSEFGGGTAIALLAEAKSGAIRAAAVVPTFDPNRFADSRPADWRARFATDAFEPGSTVKPLVLAGALLAGHSLHEIVYAENGAYRVDEHTIGDDQPHNWLSLRNVVVKSSNIGTVKMAEMIGKEGLFDLYRRFGFGEKVNVGLSGEARGILRQPARWSKLDFATLSFGQGLSLTPVHLLQAYLTLANDGVRIRPTLVERVFESDSGRELWRPDVVQEKVFGGDEQFSAVRDVLASVVAEGTGVRAGVRGLDIGGKTGTAQKPDLVKGGYRADAYVAWFAGLFPVDKPRWIAVVLVDEPKSSIYGGAVAAPVFSRIAEAIAIREGLVEFHDAGIGARLPEAGPVSKFHDDEGIPDFRGLSLRQAGKLAVSRGFRIAVSGSGVVVDQSPAAGQDAGESVVILLTLKERAA